jgi:hypothetical protein
MAAAGVRERVIDMLGSCGAAGVPHPGGDLLSHLIRTEAILGSWGVAADICTAGLGHAFYGTAGFPVSLVPLSSRPTVRSVMGEAPEAIVYRYCSCDRAATYAALDRVPAVFTDRYDASSAVLGADDMHAFAIITIANELDLVRKAAFDVATVLTIDRLFAGLAPYAPDAATIARAEICERYDV